MTPFLVAGERLKQSLGRSAETAGCRFRVTEEAHKPWDAAMFMGGLHEVTIAVDGQDARWWLDGLDEYAVHLPGFVLSKLEVSTVEVVAGQLVATIEAETVKEA
ncbi:MAG: hypothetical protein U9R64_08925 [Pseudomonadota bacterium]|nr:hypothetical protein [Pseudomonadota bacterium]